MRSTISASTSRFECLEDRVGGDQVVPSLEVELRFGRPGRARIEGDDSLVRVAQEEEREPDRDLELRPELVVELETLEQERASAGGAQPRVARAEREAGFADAEDPPVLEGEQVAMLVGHLPAAEVAAGPRRARLGRGGRAREPPQPRDHRGARRPSSAAAHVASATLNSRPLVRRSIGTGSR